MTAREELPNRRRSDVREFRHNGQAYSSVYPAFPAPDFHSRRDLSARYVTPLTENQSPRKQENKI
jgi:hypothetical protein